jgi:hypothetical protein
MLKAWFLLVAAALLITACGDEEVGAACDLPAPIAEACADDPTALTSEVCLYKHSADCSTRLCATYVGSEGFCTQTCDPDSAGSCPSGSVCDRPASAELGFCVPDAIYARALN